MKARPLNKRGAIKYFICDIYGELFKKENNKFQCFGPDWGEWSMCYKNCSCSRSASEKEAKETFKMAFK